MFAYKQSWQSLPARVHVVNAFAVNENRIETLLKEFNVVLTFS